MWSNTVVTLFIVTLKLRAGLLTDESEPPPIIKFTVAGKAYTLYLNSLTWFEAMEHCRRENKILGSIPSMEVNQLLVDSLMSYEMAKKKKSIWMGAYDIDHEGEFVWLSTGRTLDNFTNWTEGEPNNFKGTEHCAELRVTTNFWNDDVCEEDKYFFCEDLPT